MKNGRIRNITAAALGVALISASAQICIPLTVPITLQTLAVFTICAVYQPPVGIFSVMAYMLAGALGVPVFAAFSGGVSVFLSPTGGYIIGFLLVAVVIQTSVRLFGRGVPVLSVSMVVGLLLCYLFGSVWYCNVYAGGGIGIIAVMKICVFPFIPFDIIKIAVAVILSKKIYPIYARTMHISE